MKLPLHQEKGEKRRLLFFSHMVFQSRTTNVVELST